jgi:hypothetical protein
MKIVDKEWRKNKLVFTIKCGCGARFLIFSTEATIYCQCGEAAPRSDVPIEIFTNADLGEGPGIYEGPRFPLSDGMTMLSELEDSMSYYKQTIWQSCPLHQPILGTMVQKDPGLVSRGMHETYLGLFRFGGGGRWRAPRAREPQLN